jgi:hypothetical protein
MRLTCGLTGDGWVVSRVRLACDIYRHNVFLARNEYFGNDDPTRLFGEGAAADDLLLVSHVQFLQKVTMRFSITF